MEPCMFRDTNFKNTKGEFNAQKVGSELRAGYKSLQLFCSMSGYAFISFAGETEESITVKTF